MLSLYTGISIKGVYIIQIGRLPQFRVKMMILPDLVYAIVLGYSITVKTFNTSFKKSNFGGSETPVYGLEMLTSCFRKRGYVDSNLKIIVLRNKFE